MYCQSVAESLVHWVYLALSSYHAQSSSHLLYLGFAISRWDRLAISSVLPEQEPVLRNRSTSSSAQVQEEALAAFATRIVLSISPFEPRDFLSLVTPSASAEVRDRVPSGKSVRSGATRLPWRDVPAGELSGLSVS
jgi:hypothetical protein